MAATTRKHAAIMFTDIVGYTALMGSDENRAFEVLAINREIHTKFINQFGGALIKEMGDGMLISFELASEAVRCAIEIQKSCKAQDILLKIGIHEGEMVFAGSDVHGDGVNIASRIQDKAEAGFILISDPVYMDIKNKSDIKTSFIGERCFKNVDEPVKIYNVGYTGAPDRDILGIKPVPKNLFVKRLFVPVSSALIVLAGIVIFFLFYRGTTIPFAERDWIIISDFENLTGDAIFDQSLNTAFILSINQSRYVNVITRQRMKETLQRMKIGNRSKIDEELVREIAIREGVKICIAPSISKVGSQYILSSKIQTSESGDILKSEVLYAKKQDDIIKALDALSAKTRRNLGESRFEIYEQSKPLSKVTTSSLDALKEFSLAVESHTNLDFTQAKMHYENAIRIDSNFISAKSSLGNLMFERFDRDKGRKLLDEAIVSIDHLTDREKYGILAFYAVNVENDLEKGIEYAKTRIVLYPDDPVARHNLGWYYQNTGRFTKAIEEYKAAIQINPYLMIPYSGLIWILLEKLALLDSAKIWSERMIEINPENPWGYFYLGSTYVGFGDLDEAIINYLQSIELNPGLFLSQYRLAHVYRIRGEFEKSNEVLQNILRFNADEIAAHFDMGINYLYAGRTKLAKECAILFLEKAEKWKETFPDSPGTYTSIGAGWTLFGEKEKGWDIGKKAIEMDSTFHFDFAVFLSIQGKKEEALDHLEKALKNGYRDIVWIKLNSGLDAVRNESRFQELIKEYFG